MGRANCEHVSARAQHTLALDGAQRILEREKVLGQSLRAEQRRREVEPDSAVTGSADGLPRWLTPDRGMNDPALSGAWRQHLAERRRLITTRVRADGRTLAAHTPIWTSELGPLPPSDSAERARWEVTAGEIHAWRQLHDWRDREDRALPQESEVSAADRADLARLRTRQTPETTPARKPGATSGLPSLGDRVAARRPLRSRNDSNAPTSRCGASSSVNRPSSAGDIAIVSSPHWFRSLKALRMYRSEERSSAPIFSLDQPWVPWHLRLAGPV